MLTQLAKLPRLRLTSLGAGTRCLHVPWQLTEATRTESRRVEPRNRNPDRGAGDLSSPLSRGSILPLARRARLGDPQSAEAAAARYSPHCCHSLLAGRVRPCRHPAVKPSWYRKRWKETLRLEHRPAADSLLARDTGSFRVS